MMSIAAPRFRLKLAALFALVAVVTFFALQRIAHAQATPSPVTSAADASDVLLSILVTYGPVWGGMAILFGGVSAALRRNESTHWIAQGRTLAAITAVVGLGVAALEAHFGGAPWAGVVLTVIVGAFKLIDPTVGKASGQGTSSAAGPALTLMLLFVIGAGIVLQPACAARQRGAAAAGAFIDCEAPDIAKLLPDLIPLAKEAVMAAIAGDGSIDTARLKADAAAIRGDLGRCVLAGAVAALATPTMARSDAPMSAELVLDAARLRGAFADVRGELGWAEVHVAGSVL